MQNTLINLEKKLENVYKKTPKLPNDIMTLLVSYTPYAILIGGVLTILTSGIVKLFYYPTPPAYLGTGFAAINYYLETLFNVIAGLVMIVSYHHLKKKSMKGWYQLFFLTMLYFLWALSYLNLIGLIGPILFFYFLFQLKPHYT